MQEEGVRGNSKIFYTARLRPRSNALPFYIPFSTEKLPLIHIPSIDKWYPFNILIQDTASLLIAVNAPSFNLNMRNKSLHQEFFSSFAQPKNTAVSTSSSFHMQTAVTVLILQLVKSLPFNIPEAWKRYPPRAEPTQIGHYKEYLSPPGLCLPHL